MALANGLTLAIESATYDASCALIRGPELLGEEIVNTRETAGDPLLPAIFAMLQAASVRPAQLARIVCGAGPGSFTSLRVGAATAKGMAMALGIPLLAASSLALIVAGAAEKLDTGCYLTSLNAMRGDLFVLLVEKRSDGAVSSSGEAELIPARDADARANTLGARLAGSGARPPMDLVPRARGVASLAPHELAPVDLRSWEPDYGRLAEAQVRWEASHGKPLEAR